MELKKYVLLESNEIVNNEARQYHEYENRLASGSGMLFGKIKKTSDNILDLVKPCTLWDLEGDLYEARLYNNLITIDKVFSDTKFNEGLKETLAIYKRQPNGDYKRYEVK